MPARIFSTSWAPWVISWLMRRNRSTRRGITTVGSAPTPAGYTTNRTFHSWIDGGFAGKVGQPTVQELQARLRAAGLPWTVSSGGTNSPVFSTVMAFVLDQHTLVEPLYRLEKDGKLSGDPGTEREGRDFLEGQYVKAAQMLADLWYSAWRESPPDLFSKGNWPNESCGRLWTPFRKATHRSAGGSPARFAPLFRSCGRAACAPAAPVHGLNARPLDMDCVCLSTALAWHCRNRQPLPRPPLLPKRR